MKPVNFLKFTTSIVCAVLAIALASCSDDDDKNSVIKFNPPTVSVMVGNTQNVAVAGGQGAYTAKSSDEKIATVTVDKTTITVKGVKAGKATILVKDSKNVMGSVAVGKEEMITISGGTTPYTAKSQDNKIAMASIKDAKLTIKGVKVGNTTITITDKNKKTAKVNVTVTK